MVRGESCWKEWAEALRISMMQSRVTEVLKSVAEIKEETGTSESLRKLQAQDFWNASRVGKTDWDSLARAGFIIEFEPTPTGTVEQVIFRLNKTWGDILEKAIAKEV